MADKQTQDLLNKRKSDRALNNPHGVANVTASSLSFFTGTSFFLGMGLGTVGLLGALGASVAAAPIMVPAVALGVGAGALLTYVSYRDNKSAYDSQTQEMDNNEEKIEKYSANAENDNQAEEISSLLAKLGAMSQAQRDQLNGELKADHPFRDHLDDLASTDPDTKKSAVKQVTQKHKQKIEQAQVKTEKSDTALKSSKLVGQTKVGLWFAQNMKFAVATGMLALGGAVMAAGAVLSAPAIIAGATVIAGGAAAFGAVGFLSQKTLDKAKTTRGQHIDDLKGAAKDAKNTASAADRVKLQAEAVAEKADRITSQPAEQKQAIESEQSVQVQAPVQAEAIKVESGAGSAPAAKPEVPAPAPEVKPPVSVPGPKVKPPAPAPGLVTAPKPVLPASTAAKSSQAVDQQVEEVCKKLPGIGASEANDPLKRLQHGQSQDTKLEQDAGYQPLRPGITP